MSLPKEPRQKMINIMYLVLTALLALNVSSEILNAFKTVRRSLETTNSTVNLSTSTIIKSLQVKTTEADTKERALPWYDKAQKIVKYSSDLNNYIEGIKNEIIKEAGGQPGASSGFKEDNLDIVTRMMVKQKRGKELLDKLNQFSKDILGIESDPAVAAEFKSVINIDVSNPPGQDGKTKPWEIAYFNMVPTVAGLTILSKFQNDVRTSENKLVTICHQKVGEVKVVFDQYTAIVGQSSSYLMPGEELEIKAGVGAFSNNPTTRPVVSIGGSSVSIGDEGFASRKMNVGGAGTYTIPIRISFFNQATGKEDVREEKITYTVGTPGGASVALDKMNVLYIGVDNPVTIASSTGWDKTKVSASGGGISLAGSNGRYVANVTSQTDECMITVTTDNKPSVFKFRVRNVPEAKATVGGYESGDNVPASTFKVQAGVGAGIKEFPFDIKYTVASYVISTDSDDGDIVDVAVQGNAFDARVQAFLKQHVKPGKTVYVDNIRVLGPNGNKKAPSLVYYIK